MAEISLEQRRNRAAQAKDVLDNEAFQEAFERLATQYRTLWADSEYGDLAIRESAWLHLRVLRSVRDHMQAMMRDGTFAVAKLDEIKARH